MRDADDLSAWVGATLDGLGRRTGPTSSAPRTAATWRSATPSAFPGAVASLGLLEPVLDPLARGFWTYGLKVGAALALPGRWRERRSRALRMGILAEDADRRRFALLGQTRFRRRGLPPPVPVSDADLARAGGAPAAGPGGGEPDPRPAALAARVRAPVPTRRSRSSTPPGTAPVDAADRVAPLLGEFLDREEVRSGP